MSPKLTSTSTYSKVCSPYFTRSNNKSSSSGGETVFSTVSDSEKNKARYTDADYDTPCEVLARRLLGETLVRAVNGSQRISGRIVETECYLGGDDKASHSFNGRKTAANEPMFMKPGTAYVYMTYGMYHCFNISSAGEGSAVLIRALEPLEGQDLMKSNRGIKRTDGGASLKVKEFCNGPSKLCQALQIDRGLNKIQMPTSDELWIEKQTPPSDVIDEIVSTSRIGITARAGEWMAKPLRFYFKGNIYVSVRDKKAEDSM